VRCVVWRPDSGGEHVVVGLVEFCRPLVLPERLRQRGHENYITNRALRLRRHVPALSVEGRADVDQLIAEVDVSPVEAQEFALPEATEDRCSEEGPEARFGRCEEPSDLLRAEDRPFLSRDAWPFAAVEFADRVDLIRPRRPRGVRPSGHDSRQT